VQLPRTVDFAQVRFLPYTPVSHEVKTSVRPSNLPPNLCS